MSQQSPLSAASGSDLTLGESKNLIGGARSCEAESWKRQIVGARWWRDAVMFAIGAVVASACLVYSGAGSVQAEDKSGLALPSPCQQASDDKLLPPPQGHVVARPGIVDPPGKVMAATPTASWGPAAGGQAPAMKGGGSASSSSSYAFVQLAHDLPHDPPSQVWKALAMARALQRVSRYPLVLLTNFTLFINGTKLATRLQRLNVQVFPIHEIRAPSQARSKLEHAERIAYWKLQVWRLTQFKKLILLDTDTILARSIDWLFELQPVWGQRDSHDCSAPLAVGGEDRGRLNTGLLLIEPNEQTYHNLQQYAHTMALDWWKRGHEALIQDYFKYVVHTPVKLLDPSDATFGMCLGRTEGLPYEEKGPWKMPAFVHKSSLKNECFYLDRQAQLQEVDGKRVNVCHYHPLGTWWRSLFCSAVNITEIHDPIAADFCDDSTWYSKSVA
mmetsp:Transcript_101555/g.263156  ORF Transcript_101555/g.263156 Transcript_101555/m.263156 type:complete len:444 (-) Transcript_101555:3-1334(-)